MASFQVVFLIVAACLICLSQPYAITGVEGDVNQGTGQRPSRQEFSNFKNSGPAFDLYILSLQQLQQQNQAELLSYYQVAGIHGYPLTPWDGVQGQYHAGYCTHASILFPAWHRPYVALFEQLLWNNARQIASTYPVAQQARYQTAATSFRIPYWDWASNATIPDPVNDPMISINTPVGVQNIVNPLYNYTFHPEPSASDFPSSESLSMYHSTVRYPTSSGQSQPELANQRLQANARALHDLTYQLIADTSSYAPFADAAYSDGTGSSYNSVENMHNAIHSFVGGNGHMGIIPFASFDPIFWLHHANVDRLFAIWQAIYPDSYTTPYANKEGTFTNAVGATEDVNTPLTPFHSTVSGTLHTSATVRSTRTFGYTYPEVIDWNVNATQLSSNVRTNLNKLYNPTGSIATRSLIHSTQSSPHQHNHTLHSYPNETEEYQYFVNIRVDKSALNRPFYIHFFLGAIPSSPATWSFAPTLIASYSVLFHPRTTITPINANSTNNDPTSLTNTTITSSISTTTSPPILTYGQLPLNHALERFNLSALDPVSVVLLLSQELNWRVQDFHNQAIDASHVESLKVFVIGRKVVSRASGHRFPAYGRWTIYREATDGKVGGLGEGEGM